MRLALTAAFVFTASTCLAQDAPSGDVALPGGVTVNTSYNISLPMTAKTPADETAEEQQYRKQMYALSAKECADLLASIAASCSLTTISVSTQITRQPGLAAQMYATGNVTLLVEMK